MPCLLDTDNRRRLTARIDALDALATVIEQQISERSAVGLVENFPTILAHIDDQSDGEQEDTDDDTDGASASDGGDARAGVSPFDSFVRSAQAIYRSCLALTVDRALAVSSSQPSTSARSNCAHSASYARTHKPCTVVHCTRTAAPGASRSTRTATAPRPSTCPYFSK